MSIEIKLHKNDLPDDLVLGNVIAIDGEFMGLNVRRDPLCLIQISSGKNDAHIIQLDRSSYKAPNLVKILNDNSIAKIFHYGRADIAYIKHYLNTKTNNVLDALRKYSVLWLNGFEMYDLDRLVPNFIEAYKELTGRDVIEPMNEEAFYNKKDR